MTQIFKHKSNRIMCSGIAMILLIGMITMTSACSTQRLEDDGDKNNEVQEQQSENEDDKYTVDDLCTAVLQNEIDVVNKVIDSKSVDLNTENSDGYYPIEMVLTMENCDMAKILLKAGADPYVTTSEGDSVYDVVQKQCSKTMKSIFKQYEKK